MQFSRSSHPSRRGFTLVELCVVIAVVAILAGLLLVVLNGTITSAREARTNAVVRISHAIYSDRQAAFDRLLVKRFFQIISPSDYLAEAGGNERLARVMATKELTRMFFPQSWDEAKHLLQITGGEPPTPINAETENSEVLCFLLADPTVPGHLPVDLHALQEHMQDTDGNGRPELIDGWGRPIRYYRWPTRLLRPDGWSEGATIAADDIAAARLLFRGMPADEETLATDPLDPLHLQPPASAAALEARWSTIQTWSAPLIVSAGPDGEFGLLPPNDLVHGGNLARRDSTAPDALTDNITSGNRK